MAISLQNEKLTLTDSDGISISPGTSSVVPIGTIIYWTSFKTSTPSYGSWMTLHAFSIGGYRVYYNYLAGGTLMYNPSGSMYEQPRVGVMIRGE